MYLPIRTRDADSHKNHAQLQVHARVQPSSRQDCNMLQFYYVIRIHNKVEHPMKQNGEGNEKDLHSFCVILIHLLS